MLVAAGCAVTFAALALVPSPAQPADVPWPTSTWPVRSPPAAARAALELELSVTAAPHPGLGETRAVVIIHRGALIAERYAPGFGPEVPLISWSIAKSVTQALLGIAVRRGLVELDSPMGHPAWDAKDPRAAIPWRNWINMIDGQEYYEIGVLYPARNDAARMLYGVGRGDVAGFGASLPLIHPPGTHWNYNSAGINLISDALARAVAPGASATERRAKMNALLRDELFDPIGMSSAQPEFDATGNFVGSAWVYANARDWAKFGYLYLRDGVWDGRRILPEGWVDFARTKTPVEDCDIYGAGFWILPATGNGKPHEAAARAAPRDMFTAQGHEGQIIAIVPSRDLVIVRLGRFEDPSGFKALGAWLDRILAIDLDQSG